MKLPENIKETEVKKFDNGRTGYIFECTKDGVKAEFRVIRYSFREIEGSCSSSRGDIYSCSTWYVDFCYPSNYGSLNEVASLLVLSAYTDDGWKITDAKVVQTSGKYQEFKLKDIEEYRQTDKYFRIFSDEMATCLDFVRNK